ncbi:Palmitoyltransferase [Puttea exsequens]|nr:Palmitoyltransferase [Puttea exsequens]
MGILLAHHTWSLGGNVTTIEGWEIERHETLVRRARAKGGYLDGPDGTRVRIKKQQFPYDIGIYQNVGQGMGGTLFLWLWPFTATPSNEAGFDFETNGFEDANLTWPPPDPDRMTRSNIQISCIGATLDDDSSTDPDRMTAFHQRQVEDLRRLRCNPSALRSRQPVSSRRNSEQKKSATTSTGFEESSHSRNVWRNSEGETLGDFGVEEDIENDENVPLVELLRRRHR